MDGKSLTTLIKNIENKLFTNIVDTVNNLLNTHIGLTSGVHGVSGSVVGTTDVQTVTSKIIDSANNTLRVNGTNINSLINQDVRSTASPSFVAVVSPGSASRSVSLTNLAGVPTIQFFNAPGTMFITAAHTGSKSVTFPDASGNVVLDSASQTLTSKNLTSPTITGTGTATFNTLSLNTSLTLPAPGGTPTALSNYEYFTTATTYSGIWSGTQPCTLSVERFGNKVTIGGTRALDTGTTATLLTITYVLPTRFRHSYLSPGYIGFIQVARNGSPGSGACMIDSSGNITIGSNVIGQQFAGTGSEGVHAAWSVYYFI